MPFASAPVPRRWLGLIGKEHGANKSRGKKQVYNPEEEAEKAIYRSENGKIYHPSEHILGALIKGGVAFKFEGKKTYKDCMKAGVVVEPECIPLLDKDGKQFKTWDEIDARNVVIQRARVIRWRPRFNDWKMAFTISIIDEDNIPVSTLKDILERAGTIGIGDYRPRFGRFQVTKFQEADNGKV